MSEPKLIRYDAMVLAIERCASLDEAKAFRDKVVALAAYAKQAKNRESERKCGEIRIRAERRTAELYLEQQKAGAVAKSGDAGGGTHGRGVRPSVKPTLRDLGITKNQSSDWQKLLKMPEEQFEAELQKPGIPSTHKILKTITLSVPVRTYPRKIVSYAYVHEPKHTFANLEVTAFAIMDSLRGQIERADIDPKERNAFRARVAALIEALSKELREERGAA